MTSKMYRNIESLVVCGIATIVWLAPNPIINGIAVVLLGILFTFLTLCSIALFLEMFEGAVTIDRKPFIIFGDAVMLYCANVFLITHHYILFIMALITIGVQLIKFLEARKELKSGG